MWHCLNLHSFIPGKEDVKIFRRNAKVGLELLSTVHWIATQEHAKTLADVVARTYSWNERKKQFTPRQIGLAVQVLTKKGWMDPLK